MFEWNPNLQNILTDKLQDLGGGAYSDREFAKHLNLLGVPDEDT